MDQRLLTLPKLVFIVSTRAILGAGVALFATRSMDKRTRRDAGLTLALVGAATTIPAALFVMESRRSTLERVMRTFR
jgi:hydrogenase-4 membrane subunit HyfE